MRVLTVLVLLALTWGFDVFAYGRWTRMSGFEDSATCWREKQRTQERHPLWLVRACSED